MTYTPASGGATPGQEEDRDRATAAIPFDYHSHHARCGHASGAMEDYVEIASLLGMKEFGVSDHGPAYWLPGDHPQPTTQMPLSGLAAYVAEAEACKRSFQGRIAVKVGLEADYIEGCEDDLRALLDSEPFDYVLGSVHYCYGVSVFDRARWRTATGDAAEAVYAEYYRLVALAARSGLFDILSHLTVVEAYGPPVSDALAARLYPLVADAVADGGCLVEVNTSGYRKRGGDEPFPDRRMLRLLVARGVPLTFGADSHAPHEVGYARARVAELLADIGVNIAEPVHVTARRAPLLAFATK